MGSIEDRFVSYLSETTFDNITQEAIEAARRSILDTLGVIVAGSNGEDIASLLGLLQSLGGPAEATVLVHGMRLPVIHATWANGAMARAREFDDSHDITGDHTSVPIMSAALGIAELNTGVNGRDFLAAYVIAADFVSRLRMAARRKVGSSAFAANSFAPFSAAVAAGRLLGMKGEALHHTLGWAYAQCAGSVQLQQGGTSALHIHHGLAAATGVQAALLARHGLPGTEEFLTGKFGYYNAYEGGNYDPDILMDSLGKRFEITNVSIKQYPSGRVTHGPIDAALSLRDEEKIDPEEIVDITVRYTKGGYNMTCEPADKRRVPTKVQHAKFSLYYNVACALARGHVGLEDFTPEAIADEDVRSLAAKVNVVIDPEIKRVIPPGIVTVRLRDNRILQRTIEYPKGTPENPVTFGDCAMKFRQCLNFSAKPLEQSKAEAVIDLVASLESVKDFRVLSSLLIGG